MRVIDEKIKLSFDTPQFFVQPKNGVVVCKVNYRISHMPIVLDGLYDIRTLPVVGVYEWKEVVGIAKCAEDDVFDEGIGRKISSARAEQKAYAAAIRDIQKAFELVEVGKAAAKEFLIKAAKTINHDAEYIKNISK